MLEEILKKVVQFRTNPSCLEEVISNDILKASIEQDLVKLIKEIEKEKGDD